MASRDASRSAPIPTRNGPRSSSHEDVDRRCVLMPALGEEVSRLIAVAQADLRPDPARSSAPARLTPAVEATTRVEVIAESDLGADRVRRERAFCVRKVLNAVTVNHEHFTQIKLNSAADLLWADDPFVSSFVVEVVSR